PREINTSRRPCSTGRPNSGCDLSASRPLTTSGAVAAANSGDCSSRKSVSRSRSSSACGAKTSRGTLELSLARSRGPLSLEARLEITHDLIAVVDQPVLDDFLARGQRVPEKPATSL